MTPDPCHGRTRFKTPKQALAAARQRHDRTVTTGRYSIDRCPTCHGFHIFRKRNTDEATR